MKFLRIVFTLFLSIGLVACSTSTGGGSKPGIDQGIDAFKKAGLEAENVRVMTKDDYGMAPMTAKEAKRFYTPSIGEDKGGRIFLFEKKSDLEKTKKYYDDLGAQSAMLHSWTFANENILVQLNGDVKEDQAKKYEEALKNLK